MVQILTNARPSQVIRCLYSHDGDYEEKVEIRHSNKTLYSLDSKCDIITASNGGGMEKKRSGCSVQKITNFTLFNYSPGIFANLRCIIKAED